MRALVSMRTSLEDPELLGSVLSGDSWLAWRVLLIAAMGEPLHDDERRVFESLTGRPTEPGERVDELWAIIGRRGGKTRAVAVLAAYLAALCDYSAVLAPGERASLPVMSASTWQASKALQYLRGIFDAVPTLGELVTGQNADGIALRTGVDIEVRPASFRTIRSGTFAAVIGDEVAFWRSETTANPDREILDAARPGLATTGGPLIVISSPYGRRGEVYSTFKRHYGPSGNPRILVAKGASRDLNPTLPERVVASAYERDASVARAEFGGEFRADLETYVDREIVEAAVVPGRRELPPCEGRRYVAHVDPSGGSVDSMTLAIGHLEGSRVVVDAVRERKPPFSPDAVVEEFAALLKSYRIATIRGDRYAGGWPRERFRAHGVEYVVADHSTSENYVNALPRFNARQVELPDMRALVEQLCALERRTARAGRDTVDHPRGGHDDIAAAVCGLIVLLSQPHVAPTAAFGTYSAAPSRGERYSKLSGTYSNA